MEKNGEFFLPLDTWYTAFWIDPVPNHRTLQIGQDADITLIDPTARWQVEVKKFVSKSSNTPFSGVSLVGRAVQTIVSGELK